MTGTYVVFSTGGSRYALPVETVRKVVPLGPITPVPGTSQRVAGAVNHEGMVLPVIDLAVALGGTRGTPEEPWVIVLDSAPDPAGLLVEAVEDVLTGDEDPEDAREMLRGRLLPPTQDGREAARRHDEEAERLRSTLEESARIMGLSPLASGPVDHGEETLDGAQAVWLLDLERLLRGKSA
ncbi:MAG: chemotaxis protein CheW [Euryarchaeota archaeon]|nr:chemotaxis protein CheW [Euryarchaeota archaeon]